jgi:hypothetical protein
LCFSLNIEETLFIYSARPAAVVLECLTAACKALSLANGKEKGHQFRRVGLLGCFSLVKMRRERKELRKE